MTIVNNEFVSILTFLLPGFIAAWVFHGLIPFPKPTQLERMIQALILTMFVQVGVASIAWIVMAAGQVVSLGRFTEQVRVGWSVIFGLVLGLLLARWATHDTIHKWLRKWNFTSLTSYPSEWFCEFSRNETYVVLHLEGERRLYGWPEQWPSSPEEGQFSIAEGEWLVDGERLSLEGVRNILVPVTEVEMVEFMEFDAPTYRENTNGHEEAQSATQ